MGGLERAADARVRQLPHARPRTGATTANSCGRRPTGDGYASPIALSPGYCTLSILFSDWSRSGQRDLRVSNDRHYYREGEEQLWRIAPGEAPREYTEADGWRPLQIWGMGIASQDLTDDGYPEVFLTSQGDNKLQTLDDGPAQPTYGDIALERGVTAHRPFVGGDVLPSTAWHPEFEDVNNDGFVDLFVSKGNVEAQSGNATRDPSNLLIGQADGTFVEGAEAAGIVGFDRARGAALVDLNLDGMLDLVVVNRRVSATLWRNVGDGDAERPAPMGNWIAVRLQQPAPNVDAIGAWVEVRVGERTVSREVTVGGGHAGGKIGWLHAGLGEADRAEVRVQWPDGETGPWMTVGADQFVTIERGTAEAIPWQPTPVSDRGVSDGDDREPASPARRGRAAGLRHARDRAAAAGVDLRRTDRAAPGGDGRHAATTTSSCGAIASTAPTSPTSPGSTRGSRRRCSSSGRRTIRRSCSATSATASARRHRSRCDRSGSRTSACPARRATDRGR